jgi:opacity protein-like surface antigen
MKRKLGILVCVVFVVGILSAGSTEAARPDKSWKNWFGHFSAGYVVAQGDFGDIVDDTWTVSGGATWWPGKVGIDLELGWTDFSVSNDTIRAINDLIESDPGNTGRVDDGSSTIWSLTTNAIWGPDTGGKVGFYLTGGVGAYWINNRLTSRGLAYYPPICDPWFWWCRPGGVGPANFVEAEDSSTNFGYNAGIGLNVEMASGSQLYFEVKYHSVDTKENTAYVPIQVGYRW